MKTTEYRRGAAPASRISFGVPRRREAELRQVSDLRLHELQNHLIQKYQAENPAPMPSQFVTQAAQDASALAWATTFPLLVLPTLFEELTRVTEARLQRQIQIRHRSQGLLATAV